jgi:hypothetical protein
MPYVYNICRIKMCNKNSTRSKGVIYYIWHCAIFVVIKRKHKTVTQKIAQRNRRNKEQKENNNTDIKKNISPISLNISNFNIINKMQKVHIV